MRWWAWVLLACGGCYEGGGGSARPSSTGVQPPVNSTGSAPTSANPTDDEDEGGDDDASGTPTTGDTRGTTIASSSTSAADESTSSSSNTTAQDTAVLLDLPGDVFTPSAAMQEMVIADVGEPGAAYRRLELELDVQIATFRTDVPPDGIPRWDHILFSLRRQDQPQQYMRYLAGASARVEESGPERLFNYARVDIAEGAPSYTAFRQNYAWMENTNIHLFQWLDADTDEQGLELWVDGALALSNPGTIEYYTPELTTDRLQVVLGEVNADWGLHVSPYGWTFSNVVVRGWE